jgi:hypothetical protein
MGVGNPNLKCGRNGYELVPSVVLCPFCLLVRHSGSLEIRVASYGCFNRLVEGKALSGGSRSGNKGQAQYHCGQRMFHHKLL